MLERVVIVGTGLIGSSIGLALRHAGFHGSITGVDINAAEGAEAIRRGAVDRCVSNAGAIEVCCESDLIVLAVPVLGIMDWLGRLAPVLTSQQLVTDTGSTKLAICELAKSIFNGEGQAAFLPGHPMAGKESGGAALADEALFAGAMWLFTPLVRETERMAEWKLWVARFGCRMLDLEPARHDRICAWVSHLPQMVSTAMAAMLADEFAQAPELADEFAAIGGRALREMTRLGASPYSMWRDVAMTNTEALGATIFALEQRLNHLRDNLRTPELREEFARANAFRLGQKT
jgi:prephenate dehydrogenase